MRSSEPFIIFILKVVQMQRGRAPVLIGGQRATILQQNSGASVQQGASTATRVVRPVSGQAQQPGMAQAPVRMVITVFGVP